MKKLISIIVFSLIILIFSSPVKAEVMAGASAPLVYNSFISTNDIEILRQNKMKIAIETVLKRYDSPMSEESDSFIKACIKSSS